MSFEDKTVCGCYLLHYPITDINGKTQEWCKHGCPCHGSESLMDEDG